MYRGIMPMSKVFTMRYTEMGIQSISAAQGLLNVSPYYLNINSIYNPSSRTAETAPAGYNLAADCYDHYRVLSAKVQLRIDIKGSAAPACFAVCKFGDSTNALYVTTTGWKDTQFDMQQRQKHMALMSGVGMNPTCFFTRYWSARRAYAGKGYDSISAQFGYSPADIQIFHWAVTGSTEDVISPAFEYNVTVDYKVLCYERRPQAQGTI